MKLKLYLIFLTMLVTFVSYGMDKQQLIESRNQWYLDSLGDEDADRYVDDRTQVVLSQFIKKGLLEPNTVVITKKIRSSHKANKKFQRTTDHKNFIHFGPGHDELGEEELDVAIGHELIHIALCQMDGLYYLNPHYWVHLAFHFTFIPLGLFPFYAPFLVDTLISKKKRPSVQSWRQLKGEIAAVGSLGVAIWGCRHYTLECTKLRAGSVDPRVSVVFPVLMKSEERLCDLLAAWNLESGNGGKAGVSLYQKVLSEHGDTNSDSDHPRLSTRVMYHERLAQLQDYFERKEKGDHK